MGATLGHLLGEVLYTAGLVPGGTTRIIIDIPVMDPVRVYYECLGDERLLTLDWPAMLKGAEVIGVKDMSDVETT